MESKTRPAVVVRVTRPELSAAEMQARMAEIKRTAAGLIMATMQKQQRAV